MKQIILREAYDWLPFGGSGRNSLTSTEQENLQSFLENEYGNDNVVEYGNKKLRFINLVGVIQLKTVRIEILPKVNLDDKEEKLNRRALLNMLSVTRHLPVHLDDRTLSQYESVNLIHILANLYISELTKTLHRGIYREYKSMEENISTLKGRLLVSQHIQKNSQGSVKAFCEFDELTPNVYINQVLKAALNKIRPYIQHSSAKMKLMNALVLLNEVEDVTIDVKSLSGMKLNRQNEHYQTAIKLATAILQSSSMSSGYNKEISLSFVFKMNDLFESYIGVMLKRLTQANSHHVRAQHTGKRLLRNVQTGREEILLKPDFILETNDGIPEIIIDTKWKSPFRNTKRNYKQSDLYQMYAYITRYTTAERCILLYPKTEDEGVYPKWQVPGHETDKFIEIKTVRLDRPGNTLEDLKNITGINSNKEP